MTDVTPLPTGTPLAYLLSPNSFNTYVGQSHLIGKGKPLRRCIDDDHVVSMILWGPPGCGKTSLSRLIAQQTRHEYHCLNAVTAKITDIRHLTKLATDNNGQTIVFIDEIHRFNKTQQDALLPSVESGLITLIGATTENPYFSVVPSLLSRCQLFELHALTNDELRQLLDNGIKQLNLDLDADSYDILLGYSQGDARKLLNSLELLQRAYPATTIMGDHCHALLQDRRTALSQDDHYNLTSALIKSMRGSDPDAAVYWLTRLIEGGEPPEFIVRRLIVFASEDIGNADPHALPLATSLLSAVKIIGLPEVAINLSHVTIYLAAAPKSNACYMALKAAQREVRSGTHIAVPDHLKDAHYAGAKQQGYGHSYKYPHDYPNGLVQQDYLPTPLSFYHPKDIGYESQTKKRLAYISSISSQYNPSRLRSNDSKM